MYGFSSDMKRMDKIKAVAGTDWMGVAMDTEKWRHGRGYVGTANSIT